MDKWLNSLKKYQRILLFIPLWGFIVSAIYRIASYVKYKKDVTALIVGICLFVPFIGLIFAITDLITICLNKNITIFCDYPSEEDVNK